MISTLRHRRFFTDIVRLGAIAAALLMLTVLIVTRSQAAFSDTTANPGNTFGSGSVVITDDAVTAMFNASNMKPGSSVSNCLEVTYEGTLTPASIRTYGTSSGALAPYLDMTLEIGTGGGVGACGGFTADAGGTLFSDTLTQFSTDHTVWGDGLATFTANANPTVKVLKYTFTVKDDNNAQGLTANAAFTFEAQA